VVRLAEGLGVGVVEEQIAPAFMAFDVVDDPTGGDAALCLAHPAERLIPQALGSDAEPVRRLIPSPPRLLCPALGVVLSVAGETV
jgi:hypothetical protein